MQRFEHGGQVYNADGTTGDWLDFSANINPLGLSDKIRQALIENIGGVVNYPDPNATELKNAISLRYNVSPEKLVLLNGAAEFFYLYMNVVRPRRVIIPVPSFSEYERAANCNVEYFYTRAGDDFKLDTKKLLAQIKSQGADCIIIGRPNNPTGTLISIVEIQSLAEVANLVVDESFIDFLTAESSRKLVSSQISVVQSLTKIFAIPGLRLGFAVVDETLAARLNRAKDVWNVNFLAQKAGVAALSDEDFIRQTQAWLQVEQKYFVERLKQIRGVKVFEPSANFVLLKLDSQETAAVVLKKLQQAKILVRSCANFVGLDARFIRTAIRSRQENTQLLNALEAIL